MMRTPQQQCIKPTIATMQITNLRRKEIFHAVKFEHSRLIQVCRAKHCKFQTCNSVGIYHHLMVWWIVACLFLIMSKGPLWIDFLQIPQRNFQKFDIKQEPIQQQDKSTYQVQLIHKTGFFPPSITDGRAMFASNHHESSNTIQGPTKLTVSMNSPRCIVLKE